MACYYCPDCNYLYRRKRVSCPYCSAPLSLHAGPEEALQAKGYRVAPIDQKLAPAGDAAGGTAAAETGGWPDHIEGWDDDPAVPTDRTETAPYRTGTVPERHAAPQIEMPEDHDFFDVPDPSIHAGSIPGRRTDPSRPARRSVGGGGSGPRPIRANTFQMPDIYINWQLLLRIGCILFVVLSLVALWINRYVILNALFEFLMDLLVALSPLLILLFILWYFFFRRR